MFLQSLIWVVAPVLGFVQAWDSMTSSLKGLDRVWGGVVSVGVVVLEEKAGWSSRGLVYRGNSKIRAMMGRKEEQGVWWAKWKIKRSNSGPSKLMYLSPNHCATLNVSNDPIFTEVMERLKRRKLRLIRFMVKYGNVEGGEDGKIWLRVKNYL